MRLKFLGVRSKRLGSFRRRIVADISQAGTIPLWHTSRGNPVLNKATVQAYRQHLQGTHFNPASINQRLAAIKTMAREAVAKGLLDHTVLFIRSCAE
jgi:hypothetical protein